jgi:hypothetical protein
MTKIFENLLRFFRLEVISVFNKEVQQKVAKTSFFRPVFANPFWDPLDSNAYYFKTENCRRFSKTALVLT